MARSSKFAAVVLAVLAFGCAQAPPKQGASIAYPHELVTLDPHAHADAVTQAVLSAVFETLVSFEPGFPVRPGLADRWTTPDDSTWHIHVRDGVRFHDGSRLVPEDVVASIERAREIGVLGHHFEEIEWVRILENEERTIEIVTARPAPLLLTQLESVAIVPRGFDPATPIGTGPYRWQLGSVQGPVLLESWDGYWARAPDFDEITILFVSVLEELVELLSQQKLDVVTSVSMDYVINNQPPAPWRVIALPAVATTYLGVNVTRAPLDDLRVREAIDHAIDRRRLVADLYPLGTAVPATSLVPPEVYGFSPAQRRHGPDLERARRLLTEAGVAPGTGLRLDYQGRYAFMIGPLVDALAEVNLVVEPRRHAYETFYRRIEDAENELFLFSWNFRVADAAPFLEALVHTRNPLLGWGNFNGAAVNSPDIDRLIDETAHETRTEVRLEMLQLLLTDVDMAHAYLPLFQPAVFALAREPFDVVGRKIRPQDVRLR